MTHRSPSNIIRTLSVAAVAAAMLVAGTSLAQAAESQGMVVATQGGVTPVSAYEDVVAYSIQDPKTERYRLMAGRVGDVRVLPVPSRPIPFDVDLGPGHGGRTTAVYSRCREEPAPTLLIRNSSPPDFAHDADGCRLYRYVLGAKREQLLNGLSRQSGSEFLPTIWRDRIAYGSAPKPKETDRLSTVTRLYSSSLQGTGRRALPRGPLRFAARPTAMDLRGTRLAFVWYREREACPTDVFGPETRDQAYSAGFYVSLIGGRRAQRYASACSSSTVFQLAGAAWLRGRPVTGVVSQYIDGSVGQFGLDVMDFSRTTGHTSRIGGFTPSMQLTDSISLTTDAIVAGVRLRGDGTPGQGSRIVKLEETP